MSGISKNMITWPEVEMLRKVEDDDRAYDEVWKRIKLKAAIIALEEERFTVWKQCEHIDAERL